MFDYGCAGLRSRAAGAGAGLTRRRIPAVPEQVRQPAYFVARALGESYAHVDLALLLASELVTDCYRDGVPVRPQVAPADSEAEGSRGLWLVDALAALIPLGPGVYLGWTSDGPGVDLVRSGGGLGAGASGRASSYRPAWTGEGDRLRSCREAGLGEQRVGVGERELLECHRLKVDRAERVVAQRHVVQVVAAAPDWLRRAIHKLR
jgi:hypothetical protein